MREPWYRSRSTIPWINGYLCAGQAPPARRLPSRGWPITNTGTSLSLMEFLPIKNSLGFLLLPGELAASLPPLLGHRPAPTRSDPPSSPTPTTPSRFLGDTYTPTPLVCYDVSSRVARWRCARPFKRTVISEGEGDGFPPLPSRKTAPRLFGREQSWRRFAKLFSFFFFRGTRWVYWMYSFLEFLRLLSTNNKGFWIIM